MDRIRSLRCPSSALCAAVLLSCILPLAPAWGQSFEFPSGVGGGFGGRGAEISVEAQFTPPRGETPALLFVTAEIGSGFHVYAADQGALPDGGGGPQSTSFEVQLPEGVSLAGPWTPLQPPETHIDEEVWPGLEMREHYESVTWFAPLNWPEGIDPAGVQITGSVEGQACNPSSCVPFNQEFTATEGEGFDVSGFDLATSAGAMHDASPAAAPPQPEMPLAEPVEPTDTGAGGHTFLGILGLAFVGGLILNVMPCVLPVIGLKVFAFIEQAGESRSKIFMLNFWYALGLISVFMVLAVIAIVFQLGWGQLFQYAEFNIAMAGVIFAMGLSFMGVWEIPIPGFIGTSKVTDIGQREGYEGAFAKGAITTLLATPCTGPFMGTALIGVLSRPSAEILTIFFAIGLGMASPYLLIGAFPRLISFLPKPGMWMETFKQFMGFVLIGTVVYLLMQLKPYQVVPTVAFLFGLGLACWWIGRVPATSPSNQRWQALGEGVLSASLIGIVAFFVLSPIMAGRQDEAIARVVDAEVAKKLDESGGEYFVSDEPWQPYSERKLQWLLERGKTVVVDFTADWCPTCKVMERTVLRTDAMGEVFRASGVYTLVADWSHNDSSSEVSKKLEELGAQQIPLLAIYSGQRPQDPPILVPGTYTASYLASQIERAGPSLETEEAIARPPANTGFGVPVTENRR